ncbi:MULTISPECIES: hypothetical protein [Pseudomonas]|uniref:Uncharacterized protein n=1 Tax=Pseudomonas syringae pv. actinidiae TaxID=103796 RepID=A0A2P0QFF1_PSESF|nr:MULTISPECIES: hypothetical protein [Pseudomonas]APQ07001.1 hypothetical protein PsaNZ47_30145 [Pseudomonas syringae pv. actinidiae]ARO44987.1 hypothetical protein [Pseudomonas syringae pv. actinidiae]ARO45092.1 hypothetical protein [Pseudomonas syringae pv. actinidiae]ARO45183.1 hypothetical protein [Pseudomonas syringae pv. actinidiae]MDU8387940.1 hypothetical protein [Pseudomonas syringae pv. actinidiae]
MDNEKLTVKNLTNLLAPAIKSLESIDKSLSILADLQLAQEFVADPATRTKLYRKMDKAHHTLASTQKAVRDMTKRDINGGMTRDAYTAENGAEAAAEEYREFDEAVEANTAAYRALNLITNMYPMLDRLNRHAPRPDPTDANE